MPRKLLVLVFAILFSANHLVQAQDKNPDPFQLVESVASATFARMKAEQQNIQQNGEVLRTIVEQELLPHVDHRYSALMILGKNAKKVPKDKLLEFIDVFQQYLITTYASALGYYDDQLVEFEPAKSFANKRKMTIRVKVKEPGRDDIDIAFKVRLTKDKQWKAYDMIAEGISMLQSKQSEFATPLRQQGIDAVIGLMKKKIEQPIKVNKSA